MSSLTLAFLGASGDCAGWALANALQKGHHCRALARNPEKLRGLLEQKDVSPSILSTNLIITKGNAKDVEDVKNLLSANGQLVDGILFGIGAAPVLRWHIMPVTLDDPSVCSTSMAVLLKALAELNAPHKPFVVAVSTTGITRGPRDVPWAFYALYHWLLHVPHIDKRDMESLLRNEAANGSDSVISSFAVTRASLLMDGESYGLDKIRVGTEEEPTVGYTINRKDVGLFLYEKLLKEGVSAQYRNAFVTLTY